MLCKDEVTACTVNFNGTLIVEVRKPSGETVMGDIIKIVEDAQSMQAPAQRLDDKVIFFPD